jgi:hypothetical protein
MHREADDNQYLHPDFHGALSAGIEYLHQHYGARAVREYLWQFARSFYAPLTESLRSRGLVALEEHFCRIYAREGAAIRVTRNENELRISLDACPAVTHMRERGYVVAGLFHETTDTVNRSICHGTPFDAELIDYDQQTGRGVQRFYRRPA